MLRTTGVVCVVGVGPRYLTWAFSWRLAWCFLWFEKWVRNPVGDCGAAGECNGDEFPGTQCAGADRQGLSGLLGPVSPGLPGVDLAAQRGLTVSCHHPDYPLLAGVGCHRGARARH